MISVSALTSYLYCPRKLYLNYVLGISGFPRKEAVYGTVKHKVIEYVNNQEQAIVSSVSQGMDDESIGQLYRSAYYNALLSALDSAKQELKRLKIRKKEVFDDVWPSIMGEASLRASNVASFALKHNVFGAGLWSALTPKYVSEYSVSSSRLGLTGRIDKVARHGKKLVPLELKSGKHPSSGLWPNHRVQLAAYIMMLREKCPSLSEGYVEYIDSGEKRKLVMNDFMEEEIISLIGKVKALFRSKELPPKVKNEAKCRNCGIREQCSSL